MILQHGNTCGSRCVLMIYPDSGVTCTSEETIFKAYVTMTGVEAPTGCTQIRRGAAPRL